MGGRAKQGIWKRILWRTRAWIAWMFGLTLVAPGRTHVLELRGPSPPRRPSPPAAPAAPPGRLSHVVETSSVMSAALVQLNRQSLVLLLEQTLSEAGERCRCLEDRLDEEARRSSALRLEVEALQLAVRAQGARLDALRAPRGRRLARRALPRRGRRRG